MTPLEPKIRPQAAEEAADWYMRLLEGELTLDAQSQLNEWLDADARNGELLDQAAVTWRAVERQASSPSMIALRREALADIGQAYRRRRRPPAWMAAISGAAAAILILSIFAVAWRSYAPLTYTTGVGERRLVTLADGSTMSLDASSQVKVRFTRDHRRLWLESGRANFRVAKNPLRPFTVDASGKLVLAIGTEFTVELVQKQVHVILYEGRLAVLNEPSRSGGGRRAGAAPDMSSAQYLSPGQELIASQDAQASVVIRSPGADSRTWEEGQLFFSDDPLAIAIERVNRYSESKLSVADAGAGAVRISGVFTAGDTEAFVAGVTSVFPIRARRVANGITLARIGRTAPSTPP